MFPVMSKSIADAVSASELLSMIRQRKINTDAAATAYAWEHSLPMDRTSAVKALAEDFCDYMEDLTHKKQVAGNASNSAQHTMGTPAAAQAASQGADPASSHRITQLEAQLAKAQHTAQRLQAKAPGQASLTPGQRTVERTATRGRTIQEQIDRLTEEVGPQPTHSSFSPNSIIRTLHPTRADHCVSYTDKAKAKQQDSGAFGQKPDEESYHHGCKTSTTATPSHHRLAPGRFYATSAPTRKGDSTAFGPCCEAKPAPRAYMGCAAWQATCPMSTNKPHKKALKVVLRKRRLQTPKPSKPIFAQSLMRPSFTTNLRTFLKQAISKHKDHITPFFIPSTRPVFTKHRTMKDIIHNWREAHRRWHPEHPEACTCKPFREKFPDSLHDGHIAIELCKVAPDVPCLEFSGKSNVLPDQKTLAVQLRKAIQRWRRSNGLPVPRDEARR